MPAPCNFVLLLLSQNYKSIILFNSKNNSEVCSLSLILQYGDFIIKVYMTFLNRECLNVEKWGNKNRIICLFWWLLLSNWEGNRVQCNMLSELRIWIHISPRSNKSCCAERIFKTTLDQVWWCINLSTQKTKVGKLIWVQIKTSQHI